MGDMDFRAFRKAFNELDDELIIIIDYAMEDWLKNLNKKNKIYLKYEIIS